jgi:site-specific DNA recombinase
MRSSKILLGRPVRLMAPELIAEFIWAYQAEINDAAKAAAARSGELKREAEVAARKIAGIMAAIEDGMYTPALKERMKALERRKVEIEGPLAGTDVPTVIRIPQHGGGPSPEGGRTRDRPQ